MRILLALLVTHFLKPVNITGNIDGNYDAQKREKSKHKKKTSLLATLRSKHLGAFTLVQ